MDIALASPVDRCSLPTILNKLLLHFSNSHHSAFSNIRQYLLYQAFVYISILNNHLASPYLIPTGQKRTPLSLKLTIRKPSPGVFALYLWTTPLNRASSVRNHKLSSACPPLARNRKNPRQRRVLEQLGEILMNL
jgi:hypothetical protein